MTNIPLPPTDSKSFYIDIDNNSLASIELGYPTQTQLVFISLQEEHLAVVTTECPYSMCKMSPGAKYNSDMSGVDVEDENGRLIIVEDNILYPRFADQIYIDEA